LKFYICRDLKNNRTSIITSNIFYIF